MKKSLIALAVAGAMTAPIVAQADATLYGSFRMGLVEQDGKSLDLRDESTRVGIKGTVDLGMENAKGLFQWEANVTTADTQASTSPFKQRLGLVGITGDWGTVTAGRQWHPVYGYVASHTSIFHSAGADFGETFLLTANQDKNGYAHYRNDNTIAYTTPKMAGFQAVAGVVVAGTDTESKDIDGYNVAAQFTGIEGLRVSASYAAVSESGAVGFDQDLWGLGVTYKIADFTVAARYEDREVETAGVTTDDRNSWELAGVYQMGSTAFKARYGELDIKEGAGTATGSLDGDQWALEVEQKLGSRGFAWIGYTDIQDDIAGELELSKDTLVLGYRLDF